MTTESAVHSAVPDDAGTGFQRAEARGRAKSIANDRPLPTTLHSADLVPVTQGDPLQGWQEALERAAKWFDRIQAGESVLRTPPATMAAARERHHVAAGHWNAAVMRVLRIGYGYFHLCVKGALHLIDWVLESPPRLATAIVAIAVLWFGSF